MTSIRAFRTSLVACGLLLAGAAYAQTHQFNIPGGDLRSALDEYVKQSGAQLIYRVDEAVGAKTSGVAGTLSNDDALTRLLAGTGLVARKESSGAIAVVRAEGGTGGARPTGTAAASEDAASRSEAEMGQIVVTGTRFRTPNLSLPVKSYTAERVEQSGKVNITDFLNTLPEVSVSSAQDRFLSNAGQTTVRLHGFPVGTTATLLNGRRLPVSADLATAFDLGSLPLAMIDRIDILPSGSSATYGSDGIACV